MKPWRPFLPVFFTCWAITAFVANLGDDLGMIAAGVALAAQPFIWFADRQAYLARRRRDMWEGLHTMPPEGRAPVDFVDAPHRAYVDLHTGERIACAIVRTGPRTWAASPVRDVAADEVKAAFVDQIPAGCDVDFRLTAPK